MIRLAMPAMDAEILDAVREVLASGRLVQGERVAAFETAIADRLGCAHAVAVNSGTAALHQALLALGTEPGDLVIVAAYSYPATGNVVELCGAEPVFVDILPDTFNIDPQQLADTFGRLRAASPERRIRALVPVHAFGQPADMTAIDALATEHDVPVVEDAACALGARWAGRVAGGWGTLGCFSFHPRKAITTGEGGMTVTDDGALARRLRALRNQGQDPDAASPDFIVPGFNARMTDFQGAMGQVQMGRLDTTIDDRRRVAARYDALLADAGIAPPAIAADAETVYQSYVVLVPADGAVDRDGVVARMREREIETTIGTYHLPMTTYFRERYGYRAGDFPVADDVYARSLALPMHAALTEADQQRIVDELAAVLA